MALSIAFAGKGGTGKTTLAALTVRVLVESGSSGVLAVDADPNATLHEALGVDVERSVGELTEDLLGAEAQAAGMSKEQWLDFSMQRYLVESRGFDLLSMGRPEGAGCYCYANNLVRGCLERLSRGYEHVVMDNEAGLEHLSRRTTREVDALVLVSDPSLRGIRTVGRISDLADELRIGVRQRFLIVNRAKPPLDPTLEAEAASLGLPIFAVVPTDPGVTECDLLGRGLFELALEAPSLVALRPFIEELAAAVHGTRH